MGPPELTPPRPTTSRGVEAHSQAPWEHLQGMEAPPPRGVTMPSEEPLENPPERNLLGFSKKGVTTPGWPGGHRARPRATNVPSTPGRWTASGVQRGGG